MTFCPYCKVRQDVDLRHIHFRDLGLQAGTSCPQCETELSILEFDLSPPVSIERCGACNGMFFNPGELEYLLETQTHPVIWKDYLLLNQLVTDFDAPREVIYRKCPICRERMSHMNFGSRSGVILDRCGKHGVWLEGGKMRRLAEWWRAGGKQLYRDRESERAKLVQSTKAEGGGIIEYSSPGSVGDVIADWWGLLEIFDSIFSQIVD